MRVTWESAFGKVVRELRERKGLSQEALALSCDRSRNLIGLLEQGRHAPRLTTIVAVARALDIRPSALLRRVEEITER